MKFNDNFQMDDLYPEIFDDFNAEFDSDPNDELMDEIEPAPLDVSDLEDWDSGLDLDDEF